MDPDLPTKVLFLDFDGVICTPTAFRTQTAKSVPDRWFDPAAIGRLNGLCQAHELTLVISSSWRLGYKDRASMLELLRRNGVSADLHDDWATRRLEGPRGLEIADWLSRHAAITSYLILDDNTDFLPEQPLVQTDVMRGFQPEHLATANRLLAKVL